MLDLRRYDRASSRAARMILALQSTDAEAVKAVLDDCHDNPAQLRDLAVALGALAAAFITEEDAVRLATMIADQFAAPLPPPEGRGPVQ